jgi:hypothetical protein
MSGGRNTRNATKNALREVSKMPRIAFNQVRYSIDGKTFTATFSHQHCARTKDGTELPIKRTFIDSEGKRIMTKLRHITTCRLRDEAAPGVNVKGVAYCSMADDYNWRKGIKESFKRALEAGGIKVGTAEYGPHMRFFYLELPYKTYGPWATEVGGGSKITDVSPGASSVAATVVPPENKSGLAYAGMD